MRYLVLTEGMVLHFCYAVARTDVCAMVLRLHNAMPRTDMCYIVLRDCQVYNALYQVVCTDLGFGATRRTQCMRLR
eukprot:3812796-Rhodomonas_salina.2